MIRQMDNFKNYSSFKTDRLKGKTERQNTIGKNDKLNRNRQVNRQTNRQINKQEDIQTSKISRVSYECMF